MDDLLRQVSFLSYRTNKVTDNELIIQCLHGVIYIFQKQQVNCKVLREVFCIKHFMGLELQQFLSFSSLIIFVVLERKTKNLTYIKNTFFWSIVMEIIQCTSKAERLIPFLT